MQSGINGFFAERKPMRGLNTEGRNQSNGRVELGIRHPDYDAQARMYANVRDDNTRIIQHVRERLKVHPTRQILEADAAPRFTCAPSLNCSRQTVSALVNLL